VRSSDSAVGWRPTFCDVSIWRGLRRHADFSFLRFGLCLICSERPVSPAAAKKPPSSNSMLSSGSIYHKPSQSHGTIANRDSSM